MTNNRERFPNIVQAPKDINVFGNDYIVYKFVFRGLSDLYNYLKSNPDINYHSFDRKLDSIFGEYSFAGISYDKAVEQLVNYNDPKYKEFLTLSTRSQMKNVKRGAVFKSTNSVSGGTIRPHALAICDPHIYRTTKIVKTNNIVNIHTITNYLGYTTKSQVYNKAVILTNIIHALEKQGYRVNVNAFSASTNCNEIIDIDLNIKSTNAGVNYQALYRSLCNIEFLRRIIFRVRETSDVEKDWSNYGVTLTEKFAKEYLHINKDDLYFGTPDEMGVYGENIEDDFENAIKQLKLEDKIDVDRAKILIKKNMN